MEASIFDIEDCLSDLLAFFLYGKPSEILVM